MRTRGPLSLLAVSMFIALWELAGRTGTVSPVLLSTPSRIATELPGLVGRISSDIGYSLEVFGLAVLLSGTVGALIGALIGYSSVAYALLNPFVVTFNALPKIVLMPLIVLWLGIGMSANLALAATMGSFPVIVATYTGVRSLERDYVLLARSFGARPLTLLRTIVAPGVVPYVVSGLRVGINYAMVGVLIAEFFASSRGIGYRMVAYMQNFEVDAFFGCLVLVAAFMLLCTASVHALERRLAAWRPGAFEPARGA